MCDIYHNSHHLLPASSSPQQVGLVCEVARDLSGKADAPPETADLGKLEAQLHQSIKQMSTSVPYLSPTLLPRSQTLKPHQLRASEASDAALGGGGGGGGKTTGGRKRASGDVKSPAKPTKRRSSSTSNLNQVLVGGSSSGTRTATRSISPNSMLYTHAESPVRSNPRGRNSQEAFQVPSEVLILPVSKDGSAVNVRRQSGPVTQWDFTLLSEEEVGYTTPSPNSPNSLNSLNSL